MKKSSIPAWLHRFLLASAEYRYYPFIVAFIAFMSAVTFTFPFIVVLIAAVLIAPKRWLSLGVLCGLGSGLGATLLVEIFHYLGEAFVLSRFPDLAAHENWLFISEWLSHYGLWAIAVIAGSPMPQTPALFLYSLTEPFAPGVFVAVASGKVVKYVFMAWLTARYPARFIDFR